ncbi:hypothetical protein PsorP6_005069 [Peronosclerospora sorghi]|uniref:Uncharacterized protein n=1 Tax=Peronosclerospora sorghi TaxID=230839 RepID=A0ACC0W0P0_9STRA|nr:hypothetical protein PsorP6_005069 [Peronosclerospora sorghi]
MSTTTKRISPPPTVALFIYVHVNVMGTTNHIGLERGESVAAHAASTAQEYNRLDKLDTAQLLGYYERSQRRLFLMDYEGTLVNYQSMEELAEPSQALLSCPEELTADPRNMSTLSVEEIKTACSHLPRVGLEAEHGYWFRPALKHPSTYDTSDTWSLGSPHAAKSLPVPLGMEDESLARSTSSIMSGHSTESALVESAPWQCMFSDVDLEWCDEVESILEHFTELTPGSLLDYESETPYFTALDFDFILALGDERTDEDMQGRNCYTCTVGMKVSRAQYYLEDPDDVLRVLTA